MFCVICLNCISPFVQGQRSSQGEENVELKQYQFVLEGFDGQSLKNGILYLDRTGFKFDIKGRLKLKTEITFRDEMPINIELTKNRNIAGRFTAFKKELRPDMPHLYWYRGDEKIIHVRLPITAKPQKYLIKNTKNEVLKNYPVVLKHNDQAIRTDGKGYLTVRMKILKGDLKTKVDRIDGKTIIVKSGQKVPIKRAIKGVVRNIANQQAVGNARLIIRYPNKQMKAVTTSLNGTFSIPLPDGVNPSGIQLLKFSNTKSAKYFNPRVRRQGGTWEVLVGVKTIKKNMINPSEKHIPKPKKKDFIKEDVLEWYLRVVVKKDKILARREVRRLESLAKWVEDSLERQGYKAKLGYCKMRGIGLEKKETEGKDMIEEAAEFGEEQTKNSVSTALFGDVYHLFEDQNEDNHHIASYWYGYAAQKGERYAQIQLAHMYLAHLKDTLKAIFWMKKAYRKNIPIKVENYFSRIKSCELKQDPFEHIKINSPEVLEALLEPYKILTKEMIFVQGGSYQHKFQGQQRVESLSDYAISKFEVTVEQYEAYLKDTNGGKVIDEVWMLRHPKCREKFPVVRVSWFDAMSYCKWLSKKTGLKFRLPTEKEWEYAALGGQKAKKCLYAGGNKVEEVAWYALNARVVGDKGIDYGVHIDSTKVNELGLANMAGNVAEWCYNWHETVKDIPEKARNTNVLPGNIRCMTKGGSWYFPAKNCLIFSRNNRDDKSKARYIGFRLVLVNKANG